MAVGTPTTAGGNGTSASVAVPAGMTAGDEVVLVCSVDNQGATLSWPSGFTELHQTDLSTDGQTTGAAWKRLTGADSGTYAVSISGVGGNYGIVAIPATGRHGTNPPVIGTVTADSNANAGTSLAESAAGVTALAGDDILGVFMEDVGAANIGNGHSAWSLGGGEIIDLIDAGSGWANIGVSKAENVSAGSTGSLTATFSKSPSGNSGYVGYVIRLPSASSTTQVSATRRVVYNVQAQVVSTRRINYGVTANVTSTRRVIFAVLAAVVATRRVNYAVQAAVVASRRVVYDVAAGTSQVSASRRISYQVLASVLAQRRVTYGVSAAVAATRRVSYAVSGDVTAPRHVVYTVGEATVRPSSLPLLFVG